MAIGPEQNYLREAYSLLKRCLRSALLSILSLPHRHISTTIIILGTLVLSFIGSVLLPEQAMTEREKARALENSGKPSEVRTRSTFLSPCLNFPRSLSKFGARTRERAATVDWGGRITLPHISTIHMIFARFLLR